MSYDLICSRESIISFPQGCHSSDDGICYDWSVACPSSKKVVMYRNCPGCGFLFYLPMNHGGSLVVAPRGALTMFVWHHGLFLQIASSMRTLSPKIRGHGIQDLRLVWVAPATKQIIRLLHDLIKPHLQCYINFFFDWGTQFGHFEKCARVSLAFSFPLEDIKRATSQPAHV